MEGNVTTHQITGSLSTTSDISGDLTPREELTGSLSIPTGRVVTQRYDDLTGKPTINSITVEGDKVSGDYRLQGKMETLTQQEIEAILYMD